MAGDRALATRERTFENRVQATVIDVNASHLDVGAADIPAEDRAR
jgi:hypothetical protein